MPHKRLPVVTPGEVLHEEFLKPLKISQYRLAKDISVPPRRINEIIKGMRAVTADTSIRLARYFGMSERFWLNLQIQHDIDIRKRRLGMSLEDEVKPRSVMREDGAALMERMSQYSVAQGSSLSEVRGKALLESLRGRPRGLYVAIESGKLVRVTPRAIREYGRALLEPIARYLGARGLEALRRAPASKRSKIRASGSRTRLQARPAPTASPARPS